VVSGELDEHGELPEDAVVSVLKGDPLYHGVEPTGEQLALPDVRLLAPVIPRSKVVAIGRNYAAHAAEMGGEVPAEPLMFLKPNTSVIGPGDPIAYPRQSREVHFEGELAVVIGRICRDVPAERAHDVIFGYTVANDVTARDLQREDVQFTRAKGFDTFCPVGVAVPRHDWHDLEIICRVNGTLRQHGHASDMVFGVPSLIAAISRIMTLEPGDIIATGTPEGVGPLLPGDVVEVEIPGVGTIRNPVRAASHL
jgi:2-keto-4-pentenoate hydratase/2-oxohepta-3-ene-1,7-dioic acid hydratase in catechol pathway